MPAEATDAITEQKQIGVKHVPLAGYALTDERENEEVDESLHDDDDCA